MNLIDTFRYLVSLEQHKHFSRAAQACHITQPALSNAIKALEDELSTKIVNRGRNYEGLTDEGTRVLASARQILHETESLKQDISSRKGNPSGNLIIGSVPSALPLASKFAVLLQKNFEGITSTVRSMASQEIELSLENLIVDMAFGYTDRFELNSTDASVIPQYSEKYFLIRSNLNKSAKSKLTSDVTWHSASREPLCLLTSEMHNRALVNDFFKAVGIEIKPCMQTDSIFSLLLSVQNSDLSTILPGPMANIALNFDGLYISHLVNPTAETAIGLLMPSSRHLTIAQQKAFELAKDPVWLARISSITNP
jgi:DNA-binding transcriptional LysR family regulator